MTNNSPAFSLQDGAAAVVAVVTVCGLIVLSALELTVPDALNTAVGAALTWLFVRSAQVAESNHTTSHS